MYDWPEVRAATDAFWARAASNLRDLGIAAPAGLTRDRDLRTVWQSPDLLIAQTCGLPLVRGECGEAVPIGQPSYNVPGCGAGTYSSAILTRDDGRRTLADFTDAVAAINGWDSQSGCNALKSWVLGSGGDRAPVFGRVVLSGAHRASADLVAGGDADICALDAVAWALYQLAEPERASRLRPIDWTEHMPSLPYVSAPGLAGHRAEICAALDDAAAATPRTPAIPVKVREARLADYQSVGQMDEKVSVVALEPQESAHY